MNRKEAAKILPIIKAYAEGKTIQVADTTDQCGMWEDVIDLKINTDFEEYRIKPESKYRPFKDTEECWNEMQKHQPFGWVKYKSERSKYSIYCNVDNNADFEADFDDYEFADGTPFGVKIED